MINLPFTRALIIKKDWIDLILDQFKEIEIRGTDTKIRGVIGLIQSGSGLIMGEVEIVNSAKLIKGNKHVDNNMLNFAMISSEAAFKWYPKPYQWYLRCPIRYKKPIPYNHPQGAVKWVDITNPGVIR